MSAPAMSSRQIPAARKLLGWTQGYLAGKAGLVEATVARIEDGWGDFPYTLQSLQAIRRTLETAGVDFSDEQQLALRRQAGSSADG